ncbi:MAG: hypothetical protein JEZ07_06185 [Phycisphaerae bacterium]|nr:hypothetical protein [Phycisphaerae bacterium]
MNELQKQILNIIQANYPIEAKPFAAIANELGSDEEEIIKQVDLLKDGGLIRRIGAIFSAAHLGYVSTLVAAKVPINRVEEFVVEVNAISGVSHNYGRMHQYNIWFTMTMPGKEYIQARLNQLRSKYGIDDIYSLPAEKMFKIKVDFDLQDNRPDKTIEDISEKKKNSSAKIIPAELSSRQRVLIRELQLDLPVKSEPFADIAEKLQMTVADIVEQVSQWKSQGVIRRFGASVRHNKIGFTANGMVVFAVEPDRIEESGRLLAQYKQVSHCYHRPTAPGWPYNLFAMTHCHSDQELEKLSQEMIQLIKPLQSDILRTSIEYKKTNVKYFVD